MDQGRDERDVDLWVQLARRGELEAAWEVSDRLLQRQNGRPCWDRPRHEQYVWNGTQVDHRRVLVRCYHGLGDTIQYVRFAAPLRSRARRVVLWAQPRLLPLLATAHGIDQLLPLHDGAPEVPFDVDLEIMELAHLFRTTLATVPSHVPYLHVSPIELVVDERPRVGIVWKAGAWDERRSVPFARIRHLLDLQTVRWYSLQRDHESFERHPNLTKTTLSRSPIGTARLMRALDLVISVDTMAAHLAGALAVPTWTLLAHEADWRWLEGRTDTPWYPTMRLFRQAQAGDWGGLLEDVRAALVHIST